MSTLGDIVDVSRKRHVERSLCCPGCFGPVVLQGGRLWCENTDGHHSLECGWVGDRLTELAIGLERK